MSARLTLVIAVVACGCATSTPCPDAHATPLDAAPTLDAAADDAFVPDAATGGRDAGACSGYFQQLDFGVWLVSDPTTMAPYDGHSATEPLHLEIRARGEHEPLLVQDGSFAYYFGTSQPLPQGDYELSASVGSFSVGAERWGSCDATQPSCAVLPFTVDGCGASVYVALYCDPSRGACPDAAWPWNHSP